MKHYDSLWDLSDAGVEELMQLPDVGEITARSIYSFYQDEKNRQMLKELEDMGVNMKSSGGGASSQALAGLTIVATGTLEHFGRREIAEFIEKNGGKCTGSVSKKTSYLVAGENAGSKLDKAKSLGIPVISEEELIRMAEQ